MSFDPSLRSRDIVCRGGFRDKLELFYLNFLAKPALIQF
ncbi:hypothetical protein MC7420_7628 [Coleofasciculus chthonoplastes PCC 7420]|uniref:Uncharacterized protein n=1 Tax=Coleofasciculus chthonoplastes PCC 7420 TaxID=118168 RepID=B4VJF0_9CYAN|nr:hypothetical protein MC7420_7628 [Coleofasciculus chthonoplastes PCC 7420]